MRDMIAPLFFAALLPAAPARAETPRKPVASVMAPATPRAAQVYVGAYAGRLVAHAAIPPWARKYNVNCSHCHYPAPPRLNATGIQFRWAGYRMPEEVGEKQPALDAVANYLGFRGRVRYEYDKVAGQPAERSAFALNDVTAFYSGAVGRNFFANIELSRDREATDAGIQVGGVFGKESSFGGFRVGQGHWLANAGVAGFDRPTGIEYLAPLGQPTTAAIPFTFVGDQLAVEAYYVRGRNRVSLMTLNGITLAPEGTTATADTRKDFALTEQFLLDQRGSALTAIGYVGRLRGLDSLNPARRARYYRVGLSANQLIGRFEALGGFVYSRDTDLPVGATTELLAPRVTGTAWWIQGQYLASTTGLVTLFGRFERVNPNSAVSDDAVRRYVLGCLANANVPQNVRFGLEYLLDDAQSAAVARRQALRAEVMLNF